MSEATMTQQLHLASPELRPLSNIYWLPEILTGSWDSFGEPTLPEHFDAIDVAEYGSWQQGYVGYKSNRLTSPRDFIPTGPAIFVAETDTIHLTGKGNVYYGAPTEDTVEAPFVGYTCTTAPYRQRGLAVRRLLTMNTAALKFYGEPLHSDADHIADYARQAWRRLVQYGLAEAFRDGASNQYERYRFVGGRASSPLLKEKLLC